MGKYKSGYGFLIKWLVILGDLIVLDTTFFLIYYWVKVDQIADFHEKLRIIALLLNFSYVFALIIVPVKMYKPVMFTDRVVQRSITFVFMHAIISITCLFFLKLQVISFPVRFVVYFYLVLFVVFTAWRITAREVLKFYRRVGRNYKRVIIVGAGQNGMNLYGEMKKESAYGYNIYGFFDDNILLKNTLPNYLGMTHEVERYAINNNIDEIYCTLPNSQGEKIVRIFNFAEKNMIRFYIVPEFSRYVKRKMDLESIELIPIMAVRAEPLQSVSKQILKRTFDIVFSLAFLLFLFPILYIIIGFFIKVSSSGPIIFKQQRTGLYGKKFNCYKFRSMHMNEDADEKQAEKDDPRTTSIGHFLRKSNLDELPQFINVLGGAMSVVGPRPHMLKHTELYSSIIDKYMVRHLIRPGITGWAQVNGYRGETKTVEQMENRVKLDVWYLENWSFLLDLKIIFVTIINMFKGDKNAY
jgi:Undecaprenyl-phosphate glucose phosphotransferase